MVRRSLGFFRRGGSLGTVRQRWLNRFKKILTNSNMIFARLWYSRTDRAEVLVVYPIGSDSGICCRG